MTYKSQILCSSSSNYLPFSSYTMGMGYFIKFVTLGVSFMNMLQMSEAMRDGRSISLKARPS